MNERTGFPDAFDFGFSLCMAAIAAWWSWRAGFHRVDIGPIGIQLSVGMAPLAIAIIMVAYTNRE